MTSYTLNAESLRVLYEDNHVIAVVKPAGISVQGNRSGHVSLMDVVKDWLRVKYQKKGNVFLGLVHRLDRPVSGVVVFAKTSKGASRLSEQFRNRLVKKVYLAEVEGSVDLMERSLTHFIKPGEDKVEISDEPKQDYLKSTLHYRVLKKGKTCSLLQIELETGRKHQIRAQLSAIGHPILGDGKYGSKISDKEKIQLQAAELEFFHPVRTQEKVSVKLS